MNSNIIYFDNKDIKDNKFNSLIDEIKAIHMPEDAFEATAIMESLGWDDDKASKLYGVSNLFELAKKIMESIGSRNVGVSPFAETYQEPSMFSKFVKIVKSFLRGAIFALPMAISVAAMLTVRLSLWSYEDLSVELATSIAIGTIMSFIAVGGFTQIIARRGYSYIDQGYFNVARKLVYYFVFLGIIFCIILCVAFLLINIYFNQLPFNMLVIAILYYAFLCLIWLSVTVMYLLRKEFTFAGLITFGIIIVFFLFYRFNIDIITSQIIALTIVSIATWIIVIIYFKLASKKSEKGFDVFMQKKSIMLYTLKPYFIYGFLYFTFLYMDRIVSWSSNSIYMPYVFWFRGQYELGLDFALLILILPMGICEVLVSGLMEKIDIMQKQSQHEETRFTKGNSIAYYIRSLITIFISAVISAIFITLLIIYLHRYANTIVSAKLAMFFNPVTIFVYIFGIISYCLLSISLTNIVIQFSLSQPNFVIRNLTICLGVNFLVGFVFSRWFGYYWGIMGLLAGTILLAILTTKDMLKIMNKADYYIYAAA